MEIDSDFGAFRQRLTEIGEEFAECDKAADALRAMMRSVSDDPGKAVFFGLATLDERLQALQIQNTSIQVVLQETLLVQRELRDLLRTQVS